MPRYTITEPHPTVQKNEYTHAGRGGAGNTFRAPATTAPSGVPSTAAPVKSSGRFYSGRGGAGNAHSAAVRPTISFDEEFKARALSSSSGHVGRGGAGNVLGSSKKEQRRKDSSSSVDSRRDSNSTSGGSIRAGFWGRLSGVSVGSH